MKQWAALRAIAVALSLCTARKLGDPVRGGLSFSPGLDLNGIEMMVLQLGNVSSASSDLKPMLDSIRKMLEQSLLPQLQKERGEAQRMVDDAAKGFGGCGASNDAKHFPVANLSLRHKACRAEEAKLAPNASKSCGVFQSLSDEQQRVCRAFSTDLDTYPPEAPRVCNKEVNDTSHEAHTKRVRDFYEKKIQAYLAAQEQCQGASNRSEASSEECRAANATREAQRSACTGLQRTLDEVACDAWLSFDDCEENPCLVRARQMYTDANVSASSVEAGLLAQWRAMKRIDCFLDALENYSLDLREEHVEACRTRTYDASAVSVQYPYYQDEAPQMPDAKASCAQPKYPRPGSAAYAREEYAPLPAGAPADKCAAECCSKCSFFTCSSSTVLKLGAKNIVGFSQEECCGKAPELTWKTAPWPHAMCSTECGLREVTETRAVSCWDSANNLQVEDGLCSSPKPATSRVRCPATPSCGRCQAVGTCTEGYKLKSAVPSTCAGAICTLDECCDRVCATSDCPAGYFLVSPPQSCDGATTCKQTEWCCTETAWSSSAWAGSSEPCSQSCGQPAKIDSRSVHCKDEEGHGQLVAESACLGDKPNTTRVRCPATPSCTSWVFPTWKDSTVDCTTRSCGLGELQEERSVVCTELGTGAHLFDERCEGAKPATKRTLCPATLPCEGAVTTTSGTTLSTTAAAPTTTALPPSTTAAAAKATWVYAEWSNGTTDCSQRNCGLGELVEERAVVCNDLNTGKALPDGSCQGAKPETKRVLCPATAACEGAVTTTSGTTLSTTAAATTTTLPSTTAAAAKATWVYAEWSNGTTDCSQRNCGLGELVEERAVVCNDLNTGKALPDGSCQGTKPETKRVLCPATAACAAVTTSSTTASTTAGATTLTTTTVPAAQAIWVYAEWTSGSADCSQRSCGLGELVEERAVVCNDLKSGRRLPDGICQGTKPETKRVLCPATAACATTTPAATTTTAATSTAAAKAPVWVYAEWSTSSTDCSQRPCGAGELVEERAVVCNDLTSGKQVSDDSCAGDKPEGKRMLCPAAKPCEATTTMVTTVQPPMATTSTLGPPLAESRLSCCPTGYVALKGNALPSTCSSSCEVKKCCSMVNWVYLEWDDTQACHSSCGLPEQKQHRSVTCQAISTGEVVSDDLCLGVLPARERSLCPATPACGDCSGVLCGKDALPVAPAPSCAGDTCTSKRCCRTFASGFAAEQLPLAVTAVANEGSQGGMLYFKGTAPKLAEQGFAFRLSGGTGMELAQGAAKFTAMAYLKLHPSTDDSAGKDQPVLRRDGGYQGAALWELVATPLKQFKLRATKDTGPAVATCTCPSVLEDVWTHVMVRHVAGALQLLLGGQLCCEAKESTWLDAALGKSSTTWLAKGITADLHMVQLWDEAISDADATSLVSRYTQAVASWLPQQQLTCVEDLLGSFPSSSLASCKLACEQHGACRSVLFEASKDGANGTCSLRDRWVCPHNQDCRCRCGPSSTTLAANYDPGCRGAFDWRFTVDTTDNAVAFTELALYGNQKALQGRVLDEESKEVTGCALADGSGAGTGCEMHAAALGGLWEYRFAACSAPSSLVVAAQAGAFSLNVSYSTPTGDWKLCAQTIGAKGSLSTNLGCVPAAKPWWQH